MPKHLVEGSLAVFDTPHNVAFRKLGALAPGQHWSSFDIPAKEIDRGAKPAQLVTTIWNFHVSNHTKRKHAIFLDRKSGTLWYRIGPPGKRPTGRAHWNRIVRAIDWAIPIIGVLKDSKSHKCAADHLFDCTERRWSRDGTHFYLRLVPRGQLGCEPLSVDMADYSHQSAGSAIRRKDYDESFRRKVLAASKDSSAQRMARLIKARKLPERAIFQVADFKRNPDVVAEVLHRAKGVCGICHESAPFIRKKDGSPYLEVHHKITLADGGEDTIENAIAACPTCHRRAHHG